MRTFWAILSFVTLAGCSDSPNPNQQAQADPLNQEVQVESSAARLTDTNDSGGIAPVAERTPPEPARASQEPTRSLHEGAAAANDTLLPEFLRLPESFQAALVARRQYADAIEMDPAARSTVTADQLRSMLRENRTMIERVVSSAKWLDGSLPPEREYSAAQIGANAHMDSPQSRLLVSARDLLLADAIRCWEAGDADGCGDRLDASLRIARFMLGQSDQRTQFRGEQALMPTMFELSARIRHGLLGRISASIRSDLKRQVNAIDPAHLPHQSKDSTFNEALKQCKAALGGG